jgi:hypothetical protein
VLALAQRECIVTNVKDKQRMVRDSCAVWHAMQMMMKNTIRLATPKLEHNNSHFSTLNKVPKHA